MNETSTPIGTQALSPEAFKAMKELANKPFAELTSDQKIDRLVEEIRQMRHLNSRIYGLEEQLRKMQKHDHVNGKVVIELTDNYGLGGLSTGSIGQTRDRLS